MNILIVSNEYDKVNRLGNPIIKRIIIALKNCSDVNSVIFEPFRNSISSFFRIRKVSKDVDCIHVQFGGIYAFLVWIFLLGINKPKLITFHGTDIHAKELLTTNSYLAKIRIKLNQYCSFFSVLTFDKVGFVSDSLLKYLPSYLLNKFKCKFFIQSLGVDYDSFTIISKEEACSFLNIPLKKYVLFSDKSNTTLKRRDIAEAIVKLLGNDYELLIMCGVTPDSVPYYINACDFLLLTSDEEGSPNITREALSLNKRVYSVNVGDVASQISGLNNSLIIDRNPAIASKQILTNLKLAYTDNSRELLKSRLDFKEIALSLVNVYKCLL